MEILTKSAEETKKFGKDFANHLKGGEILALVGDLGSGKTTFVQGLAEGLGVEDKIISPTFLLMRQHLIKNLKLKIKNLIHIDLYRLEHEVESELMKLGIVDIWGKPENVVVIEWADKARMVIPESAMWITFKSKGSDKRKITVV